MDSRPTYTYRQALDCIKMRTDSPQQALTWEPRLGFVAVFNDALHHGENSIDISLLLRSKVCAWFVACYSLGQ